MPNEYLRITSNKRYFLGVVWALSEPFVGMWGLIGNFGAQIPIYAVTDLDANLIQPDRDVLRLSPTSSSAFISGHA
jgi:hypothetical protein